MIPDVALCGFEGPAERAGLARFPVAMARGKHLFPFRTEQLSPSAPMVLGPQGPGRVGRRRLFVGTGRPSGGPFCVVRHGRCRWRRAVGQPRIRRGVRRRAVRDGTPAAAPAGRRRPRRPRRSSTAVAAVRAAIDPFGETPARGPGGPARVRARAAWRVAGFLGAVERPSGALVGVVSVSRTPRRAPRPRSSSATGCARTRGARATPARAARRCCVTPSPGRAMRARLRPRAARSTPARSA